MSRTPKEPAGHGRGGDPLIPLKHRPQIAIAMSVLRILAAYRVEIPPVGRIDPQLCKDLPLRVLEALAAASLLGHP